MFSLDWQDSFRMLVLWVLLCFILKTAREVTRMLYMPHDSWWLPVAILLALIVSWTYVTTSYLSACILFYLVCNLHIIHFEDYGKTLERESDVMVFIEEHIRLRHHLSKMSHRFRIFLLLVFVVVTAGLVVTLFLTTGYAGLINLINGGDFVVSSVILMSYIKWCWHFTFLFKPVAQFYSRDQNKLAVITECLKLIWRFLKTATSKWSNSYLYPWLVELWISKSDFIIRYDFEPIQFKSCWWLGN